MPTTITKTIKPAGGGDYTTLPACEAANRQNLVTGDKIFVFSVYAGGNATDAFWGLHQSNYVNDVNHYVEVSAAPGQGHVGVYDETKAYAKTTSSHQMYVIGVHTRIINMQFVVDGGHSSGVPIYSDHRFNAHVVTIDRCILRKVNDDFSGSFFQQIGIGGGLGYDVVKDTIGITIIIAGIGLGIGCACTAKLYVYNCTMRVSHPGAYTSIIFSTTADSILTSQNNYCSPITVGGTNTVYGALGTVNKGSKDATSNAEATTVSFRNIAYSTVNFKSVTAGSENLHLAAGSVLANAGADLSAEGVVADIDNEAWGGSYSIGADKPPKATGGFWAFLTNMW